MNRNLSLALCVLLLALVGCSKGPQEVAAPSRDGLVTGDVEYSDPTQGGTVKPDK